MNWLVIARRTAIFLMAVAIATVGLLIYAFYHEQGATLSPATPSAAANIHCLQSPEYLVVDENPGLPNLDVIAKHKASAGEVLPCTTATSSSDIVIQNDLPEDVLGLTEHFLIIDSGTGPPPRGLIIYDLNAQTSTYTDTYSTPLTIATGSVTYWESTTQSVTSANCPDLAQYSTDGLGAVIESEVTLDLDTLTKTSLGQFRCEPTQ